MSSWTLDDVVAAVRQDLADVDCWARDGIHPEGAVRRGEELLVEFRWRRNPHLYAFPVPLTDRTVSPWTGETVRSPQKWAGDLGGLLEEELLTGYVASATRALVDGRIELREPRWPWHEDFYIHERDHDDSGDELANAGFDVQLPLRLRAEGRLLTWEAAAYSRGRVFRWVGHAAACWQDATTARLVHLDTAPDLPVNVILDLVRAVVCDAADSGATVVVSEIAVPDGGVLGFLPVEDGSMRLDTDLLTQDLDAAASLLPQDHRTRQSD